MYKFVSIIPARGGSKGVPKKNIIQLNGKPLIHWTIQASLDSKYIEDTLVTSDSDEILNISKDFEKVLLLKRPDAISNDYASSIEVVNHVIQNLKKDFYTHLILLQPTSPLRSAMDIDNAIEAFTSLNGESLISVKKIDNKYLKVFYKKNNTSIKSAYNNKFPFTRRQDLPDAFMSNGAIYIIGIDAFLKAQSFETEHTLFFEMDEIKSQEIDSMEDLEKIRQSMKESK